MPKGKRQVRPTAINLDGIFVRRKKRARKRPNVPAGAIPFGSKKTAIVKYLRKIDGGLMRAGLMRAGLMRGGKYANRGMNFSQ